MSDPSSTPSAHPGWLDAGAKVIEVAIVLLLIAMVIMVFGNVVLRYAFNSGIAVSEELSRWAFVWLTFMGAIIALKDHGHLGSDMLVSRLPLVGKKICLLIGHALMLFITWLIFSGSLAQVKINWDVEAPVTGLSMAVVYSAGVVFAVLSGLLLLRETWRGLTGKMSEAELVMVKESEEAAELEHIQADIAREDAASQRGGAKP